ncbi:MAG TPA: 30S ribosomal protein S16, partial [bacterium]
MSVKLRLRRMGRRNLPFYRIVVIDSRAARDGRYLDNLGTYNPLTNPAQVELSEERAIYWLKNGAIPSDTVKSFLRKKGTLFKLHLMKQGADSAVIEEEFKKWQVQQLEKEKRQEALLEQKKRESKKKKAATAKAAGESEAHGEEQVS